MKCPHCAYMYTLLMYTMLRAFEAQQTILTSDLDPNLIAFNGQRVTFTCEITNSEILKWISNEYIGIHGNELQLLRIDRIGKRVTSTSNTAMATLVQKYTRNGVTVMVSDLRIIASAQYPTSSVTCGNNGQGPRKTISFQTIVEVILTSTLDGDWIAYHQQRIMFKCTTRGSQFLKWSSAQYIGDPLQFSYTDRTGARLYTKNHPDTAATLDNITNNTGVIVIVSELQILASAEHSIANVTCSGNNNEKDTITFEGRAHDTFKTTSVTTTEKSPNAGIDEDKIKKLSTREIIIMSVLLGCSGIFLIVAVPMIIIKVYQVIKRKWNGNTHKTTSLTHTCKKDDNAEKKYKPEQLSLSSGEASTSVSLAGDSTERRNNN